MNLFVIGLNHKTAPIEIREKFYLNCLQQDLFLSELKSKPAVLEAFVLSTCNRVEIYLNFIDSNPPVDELINLIAEIKKFHYSREFAKHFYIYEKTQAVEHLLRVVTGLDSLVIGEKQILGQVKAAFERAKERKMLSKQFNILSNIAVRTGKKAQTETDICLGGSSVSWAALTTAEKVLGSFENKSVLVIGAGEMSKLTLEQISCKPFKQLFLMNRTQEIARVLTQKYTGTPVGFCDIKEILPQVDLCICAVDAPHYILDLETIQKIKFASGQKLVMIDISMPRNIDPRVAELSFVKLICIDDLDKAIEENMKKRFRAVEEVEKIISEKVSLLSTKLNKIAEIDSDISESILV